MIRVFFENYGSHPAVVLVNVSSIRDGLPYDQTCVLRTGTQPFIKHDSFVFYRNARIERESHILALIQQGVFVTHLPLDRGVFELVLGGLYQSLFTKREFKQFKI